MNREEEIISRLERIEESLAKITRITDKVESMLVKENKTVNPREIINNIIGEAIVLMLIRK